MQEEGVKGPRSRAAEGKRSAVETKKRILDAAASEFAAKGFEGARLGAIARAAGIQQPLIHHYFVDKASLHTEVVRAGLAAMTGDAWQIVAGMDGGRKKRRTAEELRAITEAFVDLLLRFFSSNGALLSILRHESRGGRGQTTTAIVEEKVRPLIDAVVGRLEDMRARGEIRRSVEPRQLVLSSISMIAFPLEEAQFVALLWPSESSMADRRRHVVEMILAHVTP